MSKLLVPKHYIEDIDVPIISLVGPIINAPIWQDDAITYLFSQEPNLIIASPRFGIRDKIKQYVILGNENYFPDIFGDKDYFPRARGWERHYLNIASKKGAILFWLPGEEKIIIKNKVYGAMTRMELGQWMARYSLDNSVRFCVGTDGKFPELELIKYDLSIDAPDKKIFSTLEETCKEAIKLAYMKNKSEF